MKSLLVIALGLISLLYLINPGLGVFELIPDNFPLVGNLDEVAATVLLLNCLAYFGLDLRHLFKRETPPSGVLNHEKDTSTRRPPSHS
jgi:uncharacterized membrane protein YkvA (DUF1232 family)